MSLCPAELPGWVEFNAWRTGLKPYLVSARDGSAEIRAILYLDARGQVRVPDLARYLPVVFVTGRQRTSGQTAEWLRAAGPLADEMKRRGVPHRVHLPPEVSDVRPWLWRGFLVGVEYSYVLDLPVDARGIDHGHNSNSNKAARLGMTVEKVDDPILVVACLAESAARLGYRLEIGGRELLEAQRLLGSDHLRMYLCRDHEGEAASSCVLIHAPGHPAFAWLTGTVTARLADGAGHLVWRFVFDDLLAAGATGVDLGGPNSPAIAAFKSRWGSRLVPMYNIRTYSIRSGARFLASWLSSGRSRDDSLYHR